MLIEQVGPLGHLVLRQRFAGVGTECLVGRDLGCDIVLDDEHAAPQHALLTLQEDGRVRVRDLGTQNGTRVDGRRIPVGVEAIIEQGEVVVGRTRLRLRTRHTQTGPERAFRRDFVRRHQTPLAAAGVTACIAFGGFLQWLEAPSSLLLSVTAAALVVFGAIALWTGVWSLTTKLNRGSWNVRVHAATVSIGAAFCAWGYWVAGLVAFATQWSLLARLGASVVGGTALIALYLHLREATFYGRRTALALAGAATVVIGAIAWVITIGLEEGGVGRVDHGPQVRLGADRVAPNRDIADYMAEVEELKRAAVRERQKSLRDAPLADAED